MREGNDAELIAKHAATIVGQLDDKMGDITESVQAALAQEFVEIGGNGELLDLLHDAVRGNLDAYIPAIRHRIPVENIRPPTSALEHARRMAQRGVPANTLVRGYRLGHQALLSRLVEEIDQAGLDAQLGLSVFQLLSSVSFDYIDRVTEEVLASHQRERDRWLTNKNRLRTVRVQEALDSVDVDLDELTTAVGYPFGRTHLALVIWYDEPDVGDELASLERFAGQLGNLVDPGGRPLFVAADGLSAWVWYALDDDRAARAVGRAREFVKARGKGPRVAAGDPMLGMDGFRRSHRQALTVRATVLASCLRPPSTFTSASDPGIEVVARFREDLDETRIWVNTVLGELGSAQEGDERLRETLRLFLEAGSSFKATADAQHLHVNSVKYRVQRAIERRGRDISNDRVDVEVALLLASWFGPPVLT